MNAKPWNGGSKTRGRAITPSIFDFALGSKPPAEMAPIWRALDEESGDMKPRERGRLAKGAPPENAVRGNARLRHCCRGMEIIAARSRRTSARG